MSPQLQWCSCAYRGRYMTKKTQGRFDLVGWLFGKGWSNGGVGG